MVSSGAGTTLGRLEKGRCFGVKGTDTIYFIPRSEIPQGQYIMYANFDYDYIPLKSEPYKIRLVVGVEKFHMRKIMVHTQLPY